jgi:hypothetical protein
MENKLNSIIANTIILATDIRENSYDHIKAKQIERKNKYIDYASFYTVSLNVSSQMACAQIKGAEDLTHIIYLLLKYAWNDSLEWAERNK